MKFETLKKTGTYVGEVDFDHNGIYAGTDYFYLLNGCLYMRHEPTNAFNYDGEVETILCYDDIKGEMTKYNVDYFKNCTVINETVYSNLCKEFGITPEQW